MTELAFFIWILIACGFAILPWLLTYLILWFNKCLDCKMSKFGFDKYYGDGLDYPRLYCYKNNDWCYKINDKCDEWFEDD